MAPNVFGERFAAVRKPAWWDIQGAHVFQEPLSAVEALERADADYEIKKLPAIVHWDDNRVVGTDKVALVRQPLSDDPEPRILGWAGKDYTIIQNRKLAEMVNPLSERWPVETFGVLGKGETVFVCLDAEAKEIAPGEGPARGYFVVVNHHTGMDSLRVMFTRVRTECQNTLISGIAAATLSALINHKQSVEEEFRFHLDIFERMRKAQETYDEAMVALTRTKVTEEQIERILMAAYPDPSKPQKVKVAEALGVRKDMPALTDGSEAPKTLKALLAATESYDYYLKRQAGFRDAARWCYDKFCGEFVQTAGTGWAIYNAVVETEDYRQGSDTVGQSAMFGERAENKARAFKAALAFV